MPPCCSSGPSLSCNLSTLKTGLQRSILKQSGPGRSWQHFSSTLFCCRRLEAHHNVLRISMSSIIIWHTVKWKVEMFRLVFSQSIIAGWSINCTVPAQYEASINISKFFPYHVSFWLNIVVCYVWKAPEQDCLIAKQNFQDFCINVMLLAIQKVLHVTQEDCCRAWWVDWPALGL